MIITVNVMTAAAESRPVASADLITSCTRSFLGMESAYRIRILEYLTRVRRTWYESPHEAIPNVASGIYRHA